MSFGFVNPLGIIDAVAGNLIGLSPNRSVGGISADITIQEEGTDELEITRHPVEVGANITDHAYKKAAHLVLSLGWSNASFAAAGDPNYVDDIYAQLLTMQVSRNPLTVITGKRQYTSMLISSLSQSTDEETETSLMIHMILDEVILAQTQSVAVPPQANQGLPQKTAPVQANGVQQLSQVVLGGLFG